MCVRMLLMTCLVAAVAGCTDPPKVGPTSDAGPTADADVTSDAAPPDTGPTVEVPAPETACVPRLDVLATLELDGVSRRVAVDGEVAAVATHDALVLVSLADPSRPYVLSETPTDESAHAVDLAGGYAFVGTQFQEVAFQTKGHLVIFDVSDPVAPVEVGSVAVAGWPVDVLATGDSVVVAQSYGGLAVIDVSDLGAPSLVTTLEPDQSFSGALPFGDAVITLARHKGVRILDPGSGAVIHSHALGWSYGSLAVHGTDLWAASYFSGVSILDASDPAAMVESGGIVLPEDSLRLWTIGDRLLVQSDAYSADVRVFDTVPAWPRHRGVLSFGEGGLEQVVERGEDGQVLAAVGSAGIVVADIACEAPDGATVLPPAATDVEQARVQAIHLAPGPLELDVRAGEGVAGVIDRRLSQRRVSVSEDVAPGATITLAGAGATWVAHAPEAGESSMIVAYGADDAPATLSVPMPWSPGTVREGGPIVRFVHAAPSAGKVHAAIAAGEQRAALAELSPGEIGPPLALHGDGTEPWELSLDGPELGGLVLDVDWLWDGTNLLILTETREGEVHVVATHAETASRVLAPRRMQAGVRVVNLWSEGDVIVLSDGDSFDGLPLVASDDVASGHAGPLTSVGYVGLASGGHEFVVNVPKGSSRSEIRYLATDERVTIVSAEDLDPIVVPDFTGQQTGDDSTEIQVVHAAADLGDVDVLLRDKFASTWTGLAKGLAPGHVSAPKFPATASYQIGVDVDRDGTPDAVFGPSYFPDYGFNIYVATDADGEIIVGVHSAASTAIWWAPRAEP